MEKRSGKVIFYFLILVFVLFFIFLTVRVSTGGGWTNKKPEFNVYRVKRGDTFWSLFGEKWYVIARMNRTSPGALRAGERILVPTSFVEAARYSPFPKRLSNGKQGKLIYISLKLQAAAFYQKGVLASWMPISSGAEGDRTPKMNTRVKKKYTHYYSKSYPKPNGGASMPFALQLNHPYNGYFIHAGALPGGPDSKGCIRLMNKDAEVVYNWADVGTKVIVR